MNIAETIAKWRSDNCFTYAQASETLTGLGFDISSTKLHSWEHGDHQPRPYDAKRLLEVLAKHPAPAIQRKLPKPHVPPISRIAVSADPLAQRVQQLRNQQFTWEQISFGLGYPEAQLRALVGESLPDSPDWAESENSGYC